MAEVIDDSFPPSSDSTSLFHENVTSSASGTPPLAARLEATRRVNPTTQLVALLRKNGIQKRRTIRTTCCELFSPVLMITVLVLAYNLSEVTYKRANMYTEMKVDLPGPIGDVLDLVSSGMRSRLDDMLLPPAEACDVEIENFCGSIDEDLNDNGEIGSLTRACLEGLDVSDVRGDCQTSLLYWSPEREEEVNRSDDDDEEEEDEDKENNQGGGGSQGDQILQLRRDFNRFLRSPLPTPTFDQYVSVGTVLTNSFDDATYNELLNNNEYGREWGNLFTLGTIHIVPEGPLTDSFIDYMNNTHSTFSSLTSRVHPNDEAAIDYINDNLNERAFTLINLGSDTFDPTEIDFTIRMNYTTLPNTNWISRYISLGLSNRYQRYYLSGFMSIQRTLADFAFELSGCEAAELPEPSELYTMPMPTAEYDQNLFYTAVGYLLGLAISMGFLYPMSRLVKGVVEEKELRIKEVSMDKK